MRARIVLGLVLVGCHAPTNPPASLRPRDPSAASLSAAAAPTTGIAGEVVTPDGARATGRLAITWRTREEDRAFAAGAFSPNGPRRARTVSCVTRRSSRG